MTIHGDALFAVFAASLGSAVGVVALVTIALVGLSARSAVPAPGARRPLLSPRVGTAVAAVCLTAAAAIVLFGLWVLVVR